MEILAFLLTLGLIAVHLFASRLRFLDVIPRSRWLSAAGGASVAYVFVHLMPEIAEGAEHLDWSAGFKHESYLLALTGLAVFYGLERMAHRSHHRRKGGSSEHPTGAGVFWIHLGSFAIYNAVIGYLLLHREGGAASLLWFGLAMALHFLVNDHGLHQSHRAKYRNKGRWLVAAAILLGYGAGLLITVPEPVVAGLIAFIGGGVILNVLKEELPKERESRFSAFAAGVVGYSALLMAI